MRLIDYQPEANSSIASFDYIGTLGHGHVVHVMLLCFLLTIYSLLEAQQSIVNNNIISIADYNYIYLLLTIIHRYIGA